MVLVPNPTIEVNINPFGTVTYAGNNVNLRCISTLSGVMIDTDVRVNITWTRSGVPFSSISCRVTIHEEMVSPTIYLLFCFLVPAPAVEVVIRPAAVTYAGNNVNLRCTATLLGGVTETDVRVNITWTKNGAPFSGVSGRVMMRGGIFTSTISYNQLQFSPLSSSMDNGTYVCIVIVTPVQQQFVIGASGTGSVVLNVIGKYEIYRTCTLSYKIQYSCLSAVEECTPV